MFAAVPRPCLGGRHCLDEPRRETRPPLRRTLWRLFFDLTLDGNEPVDMRVFLRQGDKMLSETWLYLFEPATLRNLWPA